MTQAMPPRLEEGTETERIQIVAPSTWVDKIDEWRRAQPGRIPSKSEAIRMLVDLALEKRIKA
jgi:Arc/MetJ-type ribon-helix-helix transcriptional regulator